MEADHINDATFESILASFHVLEPDVLWELDGDLARAI
jgi:hypothetical protein